MTRRRHGHARPASVGEQRPVGPSRRHVGSDHARSARDAFLRRRHAGHRAGGGRRRGRARVALDRPLMASARIYTFTPTGTYGFFLPAIPTSESMTPRTADDDLVHVLQIYGTNSGDANFRTNLDVTNTSSVTVPIEVRVIDVASQILGGTRTYTRRAGRAAPARPDPRDGRRAPRGRPAHHGRDRPRHRHAHGRRPRRRIHAGQPDAGRVRVRRAARRIVAEAEGGKGRRQDSHPLFSLLLATAPASSREPGRSPLRPRVAAQDPAGREDEPLRAPVARDRLAAVGGAGRLESAAHQPGRGQPRRNRGSVDVDRRDRDTGARLALRRPERVADGQTHDRGHDQGRERAARPRAVRPSQRGSSVGRQSSALA